MKKTFKKQPVSPPPLPRNWKRAIQNLDHALEKNAPTDYSERIDLLGRQLFGKLWKPRELDSKDSPNPKA
jgi:hypothetical protein